MYGNTNDSPIAKTIFRKKNKARGITCPDFQLSDKAIVIKTVWYWHKNRHCSMEQKRQPRNGPTLTWANNLWQNSEDYTMGDWQPLQQMVLGEWTATCKRIKLDYSLTSCTKIYSKWIKGLSVRKNPQNFLKKTAVHALMSVLVIFFFFFGSVYLGKGNKSKNKWGYIKLKIFCLVKENINKT